MEYVPQGQRLGEKSAAAKPTADSSVGLWVLIGLAVVLVGLQAAGLGIPFGGSDASGAPTGSPDGTAQAGQPSPAIARSADGLPLPTQTVEDRGMAFDVGQSIAPTNLQLERVRVAEPYFDARNPVVRINHRLHKPGDFVHGVDEPLEVIAIQRSAVHIRYPDGTVYRFPTGDINAMTNHGTPNRVEESDDPNEGIVPRPAGMTDDPVAPTPAEDAAREAAAATTEE